MKARLMVMGAAGALALGIVPAGIAAASTHPAASTTIKFVAKQTAQISTATGFQQNSELTQKSKVIGYAALSCQETSATAANCGVGASLAKGMIFAQFPTTQTGKTFSGTVVGGTGAYSSATGTIKGTAVNSKTEDVTITLS